MLSLAFLGGRVGLALFDTRGNTAFPNGFDQFPAGITFPKALSKRRYRAQCSEDEADIGLLHSQMYHFQS